MTTSDKELALEQARYEAIRARRQYDAIAPDNRLGGRRAAVMLSVLYDTGARVQELIDLNAGDVRLMDATVELLRQYRHDNNLDCPEHADKPLFRTDTVHG